MKSLAGMCVGLGSGTDPAQVPTEEAVVKAFNESQDEIELLLEVIPYNSARDMIWVDDRAGNGPDIVCDVRAQSF